MHVKAAVVTACTLAALSCALLIAPASADWPAEGRTVADRSLELGTSGWYGNGPCELLLDASGGPVVVTAPASPSAFAWSVGRLAANGDTVPGWPLAGRSLWGSLAGYNDRYHGVAITAGGDVLFGYSHNLSKPSARRVTFAGAYEPGANTAGWPATTGSTGSGATDIATGPEGTMYVTWGGRLQRLRSDGSVCTGWGTTGIVAVTNGYRSAVLPDGAGGAIVVAGDLVTSMRATRVDSNAVRHAGWPAGGKVVNTGTNPVWDFVSIRKPLVRADASHFVVGWNENLQGGSLRVQRFDLNGTVDPNWDPEGVLVCANDSLAGTMLVGDGQGGVWAGWEWRGRPYVAHVFANGSVAGGDGVSPLDANAVYFTQTFRGNTPINAVAMDAAPDGGLFFAWSDGRQSGYEQVRFRRFTPDLLPSPAEPDTGRIVWTKENLSCGCYVGNTRAIRSDGQGGVFVVRDLGCPVAVHHVIPFAAVGVPPSAPRAGLLLRAPAPNPARDAITLRFSLPDARPATLTLFDVAGRSVRTSQASGAGEHTVRWNDAGALSPGLYLAQLRQGAESRTARVVVTR